MRLSARELGNLECLCFTLIQAMCDCPGVIVPLNLFYLRDQLSYYLQADLAKYIHPAQGVDVFRVFHLLEQYGRQYLDDTLKWPWLQELHSIKRLVLDDHLMLLLDFLHAERAHVTNVTTLTHLQALEADVRGLYDEKSQCANTLLIALEQMLARHCNAVKQTSTTSYFTILMGHSKTANYFQTLLSWLVLLQQTNAIWLSMGEVKPYMAIQLVQATKAIPYPYAQTDWLELQRLNKLAMRQLSKEKRRKIPKVLYQIRDTNEQTVQLIEKGLQRFSSLALNKKLFSAKLHYWIDSALPFAASLQNLKERYAYVPGHAEDVRDYFLRLSCVYACLEVEEIKQPNADRLRLMLEIVHALHCLGLAPAQLHCGVVETMRQPLLTLMTSYAALLTQREVNKERVGRVATLFQHDELSSLLREVHEQLNDLLQTNADERVTLEEKAGWHMFMTLRIQEIERKRQSYAETPAVWATYVAGLKECGIFAADTLLAGLTVAVPYAVLGWSVSYAASLVAKVTAPGKGHLLVGLERVNRQLLNELAGDFLQLERDPVPSV